MDFQIQPLPAEKFQYLFELSEKELRSLKAKKILVTENPGTPCRVSLADADVGETVILVNYTHLDTSSPFHASHAVFIRSGVEIAKVKKNEVPKVLTSRLISLRLFDNNHMMVNADVVDGLKLSEAISNAFENEIVDYIHLHYAKPGCFAASVNRAS